MGREEAGVYRVLDIQIDNFNIICLIIIAIKSVMVALKSDIVLKVQYSFLSQVLKNEKYFAK